MFRDLFDVLVEFLSVDSDEDPFGVRRVAVEGAGGVVAEVFVVFSSGVVWVDVRSPHHPPRAMLPPALIVIVTPPPDLSIAVDEPPQKPIGLLPLIVIFHVGRQRRHGVVRIVVVVPPQDPSLIFRLLVLSRRRRMRLGQIPQRPVRRRPRQMGPSQPGVLSLVDALSLGPLSGGVQFLVGHFGPRRPAVPVATVIAIVVIVIVVTVVVEGKAIHLAKGVLHAFSSFGHARRFRGEDFVLVRWRRRRRRRSRRRGVLSWRRGSGRGQCERRQEALDGFHGVDRSEAFLDIRRSLSWWARSLRDERAGLRVHGEMMKRMLSLLVVVNDDDDCRCLLFFSSTLPLLPSSS
mmetsp:Transcript_25085/g.50993  ORF Transcript_25085/g.50993 Transcript_25085/m.50993 type:complete len:348 (+) Transcript_25085:375-1418(+)